MNGNTAVKYEKVKDEYDSLMNKPYLLLPHKGNYILPISYNNNPHKKVFSEIENSEEFSDRGSYNRNLETEFQFSFLILTNKNIFKSGFNTFIGYTHQAFWQLYNEEWSRPFRETNYTPEAFARYVYDKPRTLGEINFVAYDFGVVHQSNGQIQELSRSWNRIFTRFIFFSGNTIFKSTLWYRLPEEVGKDENPNIHRYMGYGEIEIIYPIKQDNLQLKIIPGTEYLSGEFSYSTPWKEGLRFYTKLSYGHGLSLQDYNHENRKIGIGITLADPVTSKK